MNDKYPPERGRRRFVTGVVGGAVLAGVGTGGTAVATAATEPVGAGGGKTEYVGIENVKGPAPRAMPQIPVEIDDDGFLVGVWPDEVDEDGDVAVTSVGGRSYESSWFQYCGVQTYPGVVPDADRDDSFRSTRNPAYEWQSEAKSAGERLHVDDFSDFEEWGNGIGESGLGKPAVARWRSEDVSPSETIPVQVLRSRRVQELRRDPPDGVDPEWLRAATTEEGFVAWLNKCTHFCCIPGFKADPASAKEDGENGVYCGCHQSVYDPFSLVDRTFVAYPRPGD